MGLTAASALRRRCSKAVKVSAQSAAAAAVPAPGGKQVPLSENLPYPKDFVRTRLITFVSIVIG